MPVRAIRRGGTGLASMDLEPGDAVIWHGNTWHGGFPRELPGVRMNLADHCRRQFIQTQERRGDSVPPEVLRRHANEYRCKGLLGGNQRYGWQVCSTIGESMAIYNAKAALPNGKPGPWGDAVSIAYDRRDVMLYAVGIGSEALRFTFEGDPAFAVFPTFPIRWGGSGAVIDPALIPPSPGPLNIDAERYIEQLRPLPTAGKVQVCSRLVGAHPRGKGNGFVETESNVTDADGNLYVRMVNGSFRRGVEKLGDIEPFEGCGMTYSAPIAVPARTPDLDVGAHIASNQAHIYRLSGDYNPLHIDPVSAKFGGFDRPILHGLCTFGHCAQLLLGVLCDGDPARFRKLKVRFSSPVYPEDHLRVLAWHDGTGRVLFEARVGDKVVVSHAYFEYA